MSVVVMSWVFEHSKTKGANRMMLLALADSCNDFGECYPGQKKLAAKANVTVDRAAKTLQALARSGEISIDVHKGIQTPHGYTNRYYLSEFRKSIGIIDAPSESTPHQNTDIPDGVSESTPQEGSESPSKTIRVPVSKEQKTLAPPENGAVTPDMEKPKKERSPAQQYGDQLVEALGLAYGTEASNGEYSNYLRIAKQLTKDMPPDQFPDYVAFVRKIAARDKWTVTVNSLVSGKLCLVSQFIKAGRPKAADTTPDFAKGINWI